MRAASVGYALNAQQLMTSESWRLVAICLRRPRPAHSRFKAGGGDPKSAKKQVPRRREKVLAKARRTHNDTLLQRSQGGKLDGGWRFVEDPPILTLVDDVVHEKVIHSLREYAETLPAEYRFMLQSLLGRRRLPPRRRRRQSRNASLLGVAIRQRLTRSLFCKVKEAIAPAHGRTCRR